MYALFMLFQPPEWCCYYDVVKIRLHAIGSSHTYWTRPIDLSVHGDHHRVKPDMRLC